MRKREDLWEIEWKQLRQYYGDMRDGRNGVRTSGWNGKNWVDGGTGNSRDGNKTPYDGMVDGENRNQRREGSGNRGRERKITRFPVPLPSRSRPDHFFFPSRLLPRVSLFSWSIELLAHASRQFVPKIMNLSVRFIRVLFCSSLRESVAGGGIRPRSEAPCRY